MEITITLTDKEEAFLRRYAAGNSRLYNREFTIEEALHDCIEDSMFDEGETRAAEEF